MHRNRLRSHAVIALSLLIVVALFAGVTSAVGAPGGSALQHRVLPNLTLPSTVRGDAAIRALGTDLPSVANAYGTTAGELGRRIHGDHSLVVDRRGRLLYTCDAPAAGGTAASAIPGVSALAPLADTFVLHSRPGASRVIYLDFDGMVLTGNAWNAYTGQATLNCPAWNTDGNPAVFGDAERTAIQQIWLRVSEDYAPFDVDVTTEEPPADRLTRSSSSDTLFGTRVLISPISSYFGSYGGIAYVGVYDNVDTTDYYKPALVFPEMLSNGEKCIAEAASHEAGHNLGLSHDGTFDGVTTVGYYQGQGSGATGWAPIMGVGYYKELTQWSKGEYKYANNTEDDLVVIQANGLNYRADDCGDSIAAATALPAGTSLTAAGTITTSADVDVFSFQAGAGSAIISVKPFERGPDLDIRADLLDASGNIIASSNPLSLLTADLAVTLPTAGTYYLRVDGVGAGDPLITGYSDYASLGQYTVSGTVTDPGTQPRAPIAVASVTPLAGTAPLLATFNGSTSYDPDGTIVSYDWDFGDGTSGTGSVAGHTYTAIGTYTATLTVTDDSGMTGQATVTVKVNQVPVAIATATPTSGTAPLVVAFDGSGSSDPDGTIASYAWAFGDGTTGTGAKVSHIYSTAGGYTATLTVTDNNGATARTTVGVMVNPAAQPIIKVQSITTSVRNSGGTRIGRAVVTITDAAGKVVKSATVKGTWSGLVSGTSSGTTSSSGTVTLSSPSSRLHGAVTVTVTAVTKTGFVYDSSKNLQTTANITF